MDQHSKACLDDRITLRTTISYHPEAPMIYPLEYTVPKKIRLMSKYIDNYLAMNPSADEILFTEDRASDTVPGVDSKMLYLIVNYCESFDFIKMKSTISFPAPFNNIEQNVCLPEAKAMQLIEQNKIPVDAQSQAPNVYKFNELRRLLVICKRLQIESLYELTACALACFFKGQSSLDFPDSQASSEYLAKALPPISPVIENRNRLMLKEKLPYVFKQ
jgi:G:T/U-mismatch repair DNA glycosylase